MWALPRRGLTQPFKGFVFGFLVSVRLPGSAETGTTQHVYNPHTIPVSFAPLFPSHVYLQVFCTISRNTYIAAIFELIPRIVSYGLVPS